MEGVEPGANAHAVMPGYREDPPDQCAQNGLADCKRENVAFAREEPAHGDAADESQRNENGIGPVERGKDAAGEKGCEARVFERIEKAIRQVRVQRNLLQQAESGVGEETPGFRYVGRRMMESTHQQACEKGAKNEGSVNDQALSRGGPKIVGAPA